jgi:hypothetical protein
MSKCVAKVMDPKKKSKKSYNLELREYVVMSL